MSVPDPTQHAPATHAASNVRPTLSPTPPLLGPGRYYSSRRRMPLELQKLDQVLKRSSTVKLAKQSPGGSITEDICANIAALAERVRPVVHSQQTSVEPTVYRRVG